MPPSLTINSNVHGRSSSHSSMDSILQTGENSSGQKATAVPTSIPSKSNSTPTSLIQTGTFELGNMQRTFQLHVTLQYKADQVI
jgi:hypothetical protein